MLDENSLCLNPFLRESQFLNVFVVQLLNSSAQVQITLFKDLEKLLGLSDQTKKVFVNLGFQDFFLQILYKLSNQYKIPLTSENQDYIESLVKVIKRLLEYGVELKSTSTVIQRIVINGSLIGYSRNKYVNIPHIFTKAIIKVLQKEVQIKPFEESKEEPREKTFKKL